MDKKAKGTRERRTQDEEGAITKRKGGEKAEDIGVKS